MKVPRLEVEKYFEIIDVGQWSSRLDAIDYLREIRHIEDFQLLSKLSLKSRDVRTQKTFIQLCEYIGKNSGATRLNAFVFLGIIQIIEIGLEESKKEALTTFKDLLDDERIERPYLVFSLQESWQICSVFGKTFLAKYILEYNFQELFGFVVRTIKLTDKKNAVKMQRFLVQSKEKRITPILRNWLFKDDEELKREALRSLRSVGGIFDCFYLLRLLRKKEKFRVEAAITLMKLAPSAISMWLSQFWNTLDNESEQLRILESLREYPNNFAIEFYKKILLFTKSNSLSRRASIHLTNLRVKSKIKILTQDYSNLSDDNRAKIITTLNGFPLKGLDDFYIDVLKSEGNPIVRILAIEGLGYFETSKALYAINTLLVKDRSQYRTFFFSSLCRMSKEYACQFIEKSFLTENSDDALLRLNILKSLPTFSHLVQDKERLARYLTKSFKNGSLNEKVLIARSQPFLLDQELTQAMVEEYLLLEEGSLRSSLATSLIKAMLLAPELILTISPLFNKKSFIGLFKQGKIKVGFVDTIGELLYKNQIEESDFISEINDSLLIFFLKNIEYFHNKSSIAFFLEKLIDHPQYISHLSLKRLHHFHFNKRGREIDQLILKVTPLKGRMKDLQLFLEYCEEYELSPISEQSVLRNLEVAS